MSRRAGFMLVETLVALVIAGLFLSVFARAMADSWRATRAPMDVVTAIVLARAAAIEAPQEAFRQAERQGYRFQRSSRSLDVTVEPSGLAPSPAALDEPPPEPHSTPAAMQLADPAALVAAFAKPKLVLRTVSVVVATPLGRRVRFDSIKADNAPE